MSEKNPFHGATFAERKAIREGSKPETAEAEEKVVHADEVEDKAIAAPRATRKTRRKVLILPGRRIPT